MTPHATAPEPPRSATRSFTIELDAPLAAAAPYFGPLRERDWEPGWAPRFLHPAVPADEEGAVFTVDVPPHGESLWVLTDFDLAAGRIAYVVLIPDFAASQIRIALAPRGLDRCVAVVTYRRNALAPAANLYIDAFARDFAVQQPPHWQRAINAALARARAAESVHSRTAPCR